MGLAMMEAANRNGVFVADSGALAGVKATRV
jgi:hypothetical protein